MRREHLRSSFPSCQCGLCGGLTNPELHWPFVSLYSMGMREAFLDMD